jgi:hypothetical protein
MTIQELGSIGELIAALAIVITLLYLAAQIRHSTELAHGDQSLGFRYRVRKSGGVEIQRQGVVAATLRGHAAVKFRQEAGDPLSHEMQKLMARLTGNYKRGNKRVAGEHRRNRR